MKHELSYSTLWCHMAPEMWQALTQVLANCLTEISHYMNHTYLIITEFCCIPPPCNLKHSSYIYTLIFKYYVNLNSILNKYFIFETLSGTVILLRNTIQFANLMCILNANVISSYMLILRSFFSLFNHDQTLSSDIWISFLSYWNIKIAELSFKMDITLRFYIHSSKKTQQIMIISKNNVQHIKGPNYSGSTVNIMVAAAPGPFIARTSALMILTL